MEYKTYKIADLPDTHFFQNFKVEGTEDEYAIPEEVHSLYKGLLYSEGITEYFRTKLKDFVNTAQQENT
jgi:hypothetical protein